MVGQRPLKPLIGVRVPIPQQWKCAVIFHVHIYIDGGYPGLESRSTTVRGGVARIFNRKLLVTESPHAHRLTG